MKKALMLAAASTFVSCDQVKDTILKNSLEESKIKVLIKGFGDAAAAIVEDDGLRSYQKTELLARGVQTTIVWDVDGNNALDPEELSQGEVQLKTEIGLETNSIPEAEWNKINSTYEHLSTFLEKS